MDLVKYLVVTYLMRHTVVGASTHLVADTTSVPEVVVDMGMGTGLGWDMEPHITTEMGMGTGAG